MTSDATAQGGTGGTAAPSGSPGGSPAPSPPKSRPRANGSGSHAAPSPETASTSIPRPPQAGDEPGPAQAGQGAHAPHGKEGAAAASPAPAPKDRPQTNPRSAISGDCVALLLQSPGHRHLFLADLEWQLLPPLGLGQFRVWRKDLMPVIYASWAFVSPEVDARLAKGLVKLGPQDWKSGTILWLMDIICPGACPGPRPGGGMAEAVKELKSQVFQGKPVKTLQPAPDGSMGVVTW